jgi:hypothetical protein
MKPASKRRYAGTCQLVGVGISAMGSGEIGSRTSLDRAVLKLV